MANLGTMLAGSAIGQGLGNAVYQNRQGEMDRMRMDQTALQNAQTAKMYDFQNNQIGRTLQEQQIGDTPTDGATDADRLEQTADLFRAGGRADKEREYRAKARDMRQQQELLTIGRAANALVAGQFDEATQLLNKTQDFKGIHSISLADDAPQNVNNPTYSVYSAGPPDANGNPTRGPHVHLTGEILQGIARNPKLLPQLMGLAQAQGQRNDTNQQRVDQQGAHWNAQDNHWQRQDANVLQKAKASGGAARLTDKRWLYQWAQSQIGQPNGFKDDSEAMRWAMDPNRQNKDYWQSMKTGTEVAKSGGMFTADDIIKIANAFKPTTPGSPNPVTPPPPPPPGGGGTGKQAHVPQGPSNPLSKLPGMTAVPGRGGEGVYKTPTGVLVKMLGGKTVKWSDQANNWVSAK